MPLPCETPAGCKFSNSSCNFEKFIGIYSPEEARESSERLRAQVTSSCLNLAATFVNAGVRVEFCPMDAPVEATKKAAQYNIRSVRHRR